MTQDQTEVVIIGAGVVGCSIALALSKRGYHTTNIDKLPAAGYGSTSHSSAIVRPIYSHITSAALAHESRSHWLDWQNFIGPGATNGYASYTECGGIVLVPAGDEAAYEPQCEAMTEVGVNFKQISATEIENLYPEIDLRKFGPPRLLNDPTFGKSSAGAIGSGILVSEAGYVSDPQLATQNLQFAAEALGASFRFKSEVASIKPQRSVTLTSGEVIEAEIIINASGPHSAAINKLAGVDLAIATKPIKHEVAYVSAKNQHFAKGARFLVDLDTGTYQKPDGPDLVIGTADPECDTEQIVDPDDQTLTFTDQWQTQVLRTAQRFPLLEVPNTARGTIGIYDVSEDWIPIYDKTDQPGYFVAIGTSGNQFKNAPLIGEVMAEIIEYADSHDTDPATLALPNIARSLDLSFFSRNRKVQNLSGVLA